MSKRTYRWKGRIVSESTYRKRLAQVKCGLFRKKVETVREETNIGPSTKENVSEKPDFMDGRRIVELQFLGEQLWCVSCKETLSLQYIEREIHRGLASQLFVRCHKCLIINEVSTGKQQISADKRRTHYDINSKAVLGILHSGLGWTHFKKLFACINIPCFDFHTFKRYEREIGLAAENIAKESCKKATAIERKLTLEQVEDIEQQL